MPTASSRPRPCEKKLDSELQAGLRAWLENTYREIILSQPKRPARMAYFDRAVRESHGARVREISEARERGARMVGTFCIFVPDELVLAVGAIPVALCGGTPFSIPYAENVFPRDICPLIKSTLGMVFSRTCAFAPIKDLAVGETTCDAKKKTWDILAARTNFHVLEVPQKKTPQARALWLQEVRDFKSRLEDLTGRRMEADALAGAIRLVNRKRRLLQALNDLRNVPSPPISGKDALVVVQAALTDDPERFCDELEGLLAELRERVRRGISPFAPGMQRVLVAGCPSVAGNWKIHHVIETSGAAVVCDESCTGTRYVDHLVDETGRTVEEQIEAIADRYLRIPCACFSPNTERVEQVVKMAREHRADAVVQYILQYCHTYNIEAIRVAGALKEADIPSLAIETDYSYEDMGQLRTRVQALLESVKR